MPARQQPSLLDRLPAVRGRLTAAASLARYTWFKVGGAAEVLFRPEDVTDLSAFLAQLPADIPLTVIGNASNLLVRDGGIAGVVIRLGSGFSRIDTDGVTINAGAAAADLTLARKARDAAIDGFGFLSGIPGTIGGSVVMNAGAYGSEVSDICQTVTSLDRAGQVHEIAAADLEFGYRRSSLDPDWIVTGLQLRGRAGNLTDISAQMEQIRSEREKTQPVRTLTGGSTFANPPGHTAWQLIDQAGCRGLRRGDAMVSELHCNFLINTGAATAADLEGLGEEVRRRVFDNCGIRLAWEIRCIGMPDQSVRKEIDHD